MELVPGGELGGRGTVQLGPGETLLPGADQEQPGAVDVVDDVSEGALRHEDSRPVSSSRVSVETSTASGGPQDESNKRPRARARARLPPQPSARTSSVGGVDTSAGASTGTAPGDEDSTSIGTAASRKHVTVAAPTAPTGDDDDDAVGDARLARDFPEDFAPQSPTTSPTAVGGMVAVPRNGGGSQQVSVRTEDPEAMLTAQLVNVVKEEMLNVLRGVHTEWRPVKLLLDQLQRQRIYFELRNPGLANLNVLAAHAKGKKSDEEQFVKRVECYEVGLRVNHGRRKVMVGGR